MRYLSLFLLIIGVLACERGENPELDPEMTSSSDLVCKFQTPMKGETPGPNQSCVFWEFSEEGVFTMTHFNAGFNCCPEEILTSMSISGDTIYITEKDSVQLCRCNCLYDVDFVIQNLKEQVYVVKFNEPFVSDPKVPLVFSVDLKNEVSGKACDYRDYYPWQ